MKVDKMEEAIIIKNLKNYANIRKDFDWKDYYLRR